MATPSRICSPSVNAGIRDVITIRCVFAGSSAQKRRTTAVLCALALSIAFPIEGKAKDPNNIATGFAVADGSLIVTSRHVIQGKPCVAVADGAPQTDQPGPPTLHWEAARVLASSTRFDVAVLQVRTKRPPLSLALWSSVPIGLEALVVGFPQPSVLGHTAKVTEGLVSGIPEGGRNLSLFQLSATIQLGNSGGPVLSLDGLVVGLVRARTEPGAFGKDPSAAPQIVNFAVNSGALYDFLVSAGVNPRQQPVIPNAALRPFEVFRRSQPSVLLVAAGDWRGDEHPTIAGQKLKEALADACDKV